MEIPHSRTSRALMDAHMLLTSSFWSKTRMQHSQQDHRQRKEDYRHWHNMPATVAEESQQGDISTAPSTSGTIRTAHTLDDLAKLSKIWANQLQQPRKLKPVPGTPKSLTPSQMAPGRQMNRPKKETASKPTTSAKIKPDVNASMTQKAQKTTPTPSSDKKSVRTLPAAKITTPTKSGTDSKKKKEKVHMGTIQKIPPYEPKPETTGIRPYTKRNTNGAYSWQQASCHHHS